MRRISLRRGVAFTTVCMGAVLAAPASAMALSTHSATTSKVNSAGQLVAVANCGAGEHVVSGGYKSSNKSGLGAAAESFGLLKSNSWVVVFDPTGAQTLTTYAYCARRANITGYGTATTAVAAPPNTTETEHCAPGQTLVSGGYQLSPDNEFNSPTYSDYVHAGGWTVTSALAIPGGLGVLANCMPARVIKVRSASSASITHKGSGSATASCHKGETLLSGGYTTTPTPDYANTAGPDLFYSASYRSGVRSWTASAHNFSHMAGKITAFAYCT
jgi:hypothetical protein